MAQRKPKEQTTFDQVLKLVHQLTAPEQQRLLEQLKLEDLRREICKGIEASARGEVLSLEELNQRLDAKHVEILERQKK
jgi:hypothetical protein